MTTLLKETFLKTKHFYFKRENNGIMLTETEKFMKRDSFNNKPLSSAT